MIEDALMPQFDTHSFIQNLAEEMVLAYDSAAQATTPGLIGNAREDAVRTKLESILPGGVSVGTGCVFDSEGNASGQMDVVLYESQFCPVFKVAEDVSYYPCESVIAVGSIKSTIGKKELGDIYRNLASVRRLKKFAKPRGEEAAPGTVSVRPYLEKSTRLVKGDWETIQKFVVCRTDLRVWVRPIFQCKTREDDEPYYGPVCYNPGGVTAKCGVDCRQADVGARRRQADVV